LILALFEKFSPGRSGLFPRARFRPGDRALLRGLQRSRLVTEPGDGTRGVAPHALDQNDADRLWNETTRLLHR
jgi:hypothetical protein